MILSFAWLACRSDPAEPSIPPPSSSEPTPCELETCPPLPDELTLLPVGSGTFAVGVGGAMTLTAWDGQDVVDVPFEVEADAPLVVLLAAPPSLTIGAEAPGTANVRLRRPQDGALMGRIAVEARAIAAFEVHDLWSVGQPLEFGVAAWADDGMAVIDETTTYGFGGISSGTQIAWNSVAMGPLDTGVYSFTAHPGDGTAHVIELEVAGVDDLVFVSASNFVEGTYEDQHLLGGLGNLVCFAALNGGRAVGGAAWTFELDSEAADLGAFGTCANVWPNASKGSVDLTVSVNGSISEAFTFELRPGGAT